MARSEDTSDEIETIAAEFAKIMGAPTKVERPPGTITVREYADANDVKQNAAGEFLLKLYRDGKAERFKIGGMYCYRLK